MSKVTDILDMVKEMTVLELSELVKAFEEEFGVSALLLLNCCRCSCCWWCCSLLVALLKKKRTLMLSSPILVNKESYRHQRLSVKITGLGLKGQGSAVGCS